MTTPEEQTSAPNTSTPAPNSVWVERTGNGTYVGRNSRGAEVAIGPNSAGAVFNPGELMKVALAACAGMSSEGAFSRRLGDDYQATIHGGGTKHETEDRYIEVTETFDIDLSGLDPKERDKLVVIAKRAIEASCTVGNTIRNGAIVSTTI